MSNLPLEEQLEAWLKYYGIEFTYKAHGTYEIQASPQLLKIFEKANETLPATG